MSAKFSSDGTVQAPTYYDGPADVTGDVHLRIRYFTYQTEAGMVAGRNTNEMFTIERPAKDVWPYLKDFNLWQNAYGFAYSGIVGDLEGGNFYISARLKSSGEEGDLANRTLLEQDLTATIDPNEPIQQV